VKSSNIIWLVGSRCDRRSLKEGSECRTCWCSIMISLVNGCGTMGLRERLGGEWHEL
jgi:hypothetical protein